MCSTQFYMQTRVYSVLLETFSLLSPHAREMGLESILSANFIEGVKSNYCIYESSSCFFLSNIQPFGFSVNEANAQN